jgi:hypothetical protein
VDGGRWEKCEEEEQGVMMSIVVRMVDSFGKREKMECTCVKVGSIVICCMVVRDRAVVLKRWSGKGRRRELG